MASVALTDDQIEKGLAQLKGWTREGDKITKTFKLPSYTAGLAMATTIGVMAEGHDHHPDLFIGYKTVRVEFSTHDAGNKISQKDMDIALAIDSLPYPKSS